MLGQHRSSQRHIARGRGDEDRLVADMIELARCYGRYGYRRIAALLRDAGWQVNDKRVERLWRREGLKVPGKQPKRGRLWLNDGSCIRLRAQGAGHVWSYDFVHHRTHDGRAFRMLNVLDEFTRESLAIRVRRKLSSADVIDVPDRPVHRARHSGLHPFRQWPGVRRRFGAAMGRRSGRPHRLHRAWLALGERFHRELQRTATRRAPERGDLLHPERSPGSHRIVAASLQRRTPTQQSGIPAAGSGDDCDAGLAARLRFAPPAGQPGRETINALTFKLDQSEGAGQLFFLRSMMRTGGPCLNCSDLDSRLVSCAFWYRYGSFRLMYLPPGVRSPQKMP